jgi:putative Mg2+ transporter-C (MgtC) family protein
MTITFEEILKLVAALLLGGAIGLERELHHKAAGFRTITLICIGATFFTILSIRIPSAGAVAASIVTGIGFLGAGVILHETNRVTGLTTAATIWLSAAVGMGIGAGAYLLSLSVTIAALLVVRLFSYVEHHVDAFWESRQYEITMPFEVIKPIVLTETVQKDTAGGVQPAFDSRIDKVEQLQAYLKSCGLKGHLIQKEKNEGHLEVTLAVSGSTRKQNSFVDLALVDPEILSIQW